jgi:hypothetical protein
MNVGTRFFPENPPAGRLQKESLLLSARHGKAAVSSVLPRNRINKTLPFCSFFAKKRASKPSPRIQPRALIC